MNKPSVIFFINYFFPHPTGASYSAIRLARSLRDIGVRIQWIVHDRDDQWMGGEEYEGFPVQAFYFGDAGKRRKLIGLAALTWYLWRKRKEFDIFHIHGGGHMNLLIAGWVKLLFPRKKVLLKCTQDGWDTPDGIHKEKYGWLLFWIYKRLDGVVAMTSGQYKKLGTYGCKGVFAMIPNGTDYERFRPDATERGRIREKLDIPGDAVVLVYVGWLGQRKGTDVLFKTWERLNEHFRNVYLMAVGEYRKNQDTEAELAALFEKECIDPSLLQHPQFKRVGHVKDAERYLQAADIFLFPSRTEGFGTVQTEAMACGLPCVVNDLQGISSDIYPDASVGFRVEGNDVDRFVRICTDLFEHPTKRAAIGTAARQRVIEHFSLESVGRRYLEFYEKMVRFRD